MKTKIFSCTDSNNHDTQVKINKFFKDLNIELIDFKFNSVYNERMEWVTNTYVYIYKVKD